MSLLFFFTITIVFLAIGLESLSLLSQLQGIMNYIFQNKAFLIHSSMTLFLWTLSFISIGFLQQGQTNKHCLSFTGFSNPLCKRTPSTITSSL